MRRSATRTLLLASFLFFVSGALGLGYEWIWIRKAALVVGASQIALSTVLTAFFAGLAAGSYTVGRYVRSRRFNALATYGLFEIAIGCFALAFPSLFAVLGKVYAAAYPAFAGSAAGLLLLRFGLLFALFVVPTFLMGGTLPLLLRGLAAHDRALGPRISWLYGINILGATVGVLATSYLSVPLLGLNASSVVAGLLNVVVGAVALASFRGEVPAENAEEHPALGRWLPTLSFASGLAALGYQICWARYFSLVHFSSVQSTAMLLAVYLLALAAGSLLLGASLRLRLAPLRAFVIVESLVPVAVWACLPAWRYADYRFAVRREFTAQGGAVPAITLETAHDYPRFWHLAGETADAVFIAPLAQTALSTLVPVLLLGAGLPALLAAAAKDSASVKSTSGRLVFHNTLGAAAGSFLAGYALVPGLGLHKAILALGWLSAALSFACAWHSAKGVVLRYLVPAAAAMALVAIGVATPDTTARTIRERQIGRDTERARLTTTIEGPLTTAWLIQDELALRVGSGAVQMGNVPLRGVGLQVVEGHLPVLLFPGNALPQDCLGICLGSGQSFGALLRYPIRKLDVVEISSEITQLARGALAPHNHGLASDPRVRLHLDDGRHFAARSPGASFDLISMESPPPIADGAHSLYTVEFYREIRRVLRPGGVFMQFMPLYYLSPLDARSVLRTLAQEFPYVFVARVSSGDFMLLAYPERPAWQPLAISERARRFAEEWTSRGMAPAPPTPDFPSPWASFEGVASMLVAGPQETAKLSGGVILRDDRPLLSYSTGDRWLSRRYLGPTLASLSLAAVPISPYASIAEYFEPPLDDATADALSDARAVLFRTQGFPGPREIERRELALELAVDPGDRVRRALDLAVTYDAALRKEEALKSIDVALSALQSDPEPFREEWISPARGVILRHLAVHEALVGKWIGVWRTRYPNSPLVTPLIAEWDAYQQREAEGRRRYLFH